MRERCAHDPIGPLRPHLPCAWPRCPMGTDQEWWYVPCPIPIQAPWSYVAGEVAGPTLKCDVYRRMAYGFWEPTAEPPWRWRTLGFDWVKQAEEGEQNG